MKVSVKHVKINNLMTMKESLERFCGVEIVVETNGFGLELVKKTAWI